MSRGPGESWRVVWDVSLYPRGRGLLLWGWHLLVYSLLQSPNPGLRLWSSPDRSSPRRESPSRWACHHRGVTCHDPWWGQGARRLGRGGGVGSLTGVIIEVWPAMLPGAQPDNCHRCYLAIGAHLTCCDSKISSTCDNIMRQTHFTVPWVWSSCQEGRQPPSAIKLIVLEEMRPSDIVISFSSKSWCSQPLVYKILAVSSRNVWHYKVLQVRVLPHLLLSNRMKWLAFLNGTAKVTLNDTTTGPEEHMTDYMHHGLEKVHPVICHGALCNHLHCQLNWLTGGSLRCDQQLFAFRTHGSRSGAVK